MSKRVLNLWILLTIVFASKSCQSQVPQITKNTNNHVDTFTNPTSTKKVSIHKDFCKSRNAKCKFHSCSECVCRSYKEAFISYQQGCLNESAAYNNILKVSQCMLEHRVRNSVKNYIPMARIDTLRRHHLFNNSYCYTEMEMPKHVNGTLGSCRPTGLTFYDIKYGEESTLNQQFYQMFDIKKEHNYEYGENRSYYCLRCHSNNCNLTDLKGYLLRLSINCTTTVLAETKFVATCFVFSIEGSHKLNTETSLTPVVPKPKTQGVLTVQRIFKSVDYFTNLDEIWDFCYEFHGSCTSSSACDKCACQYYTDRTFVSYRHGCVKTSEIQEILKLKDCAKSRECTDEIIFVEKETFKYGTCINLQLFSKLLGNQDEWSCAIESTKYINGLNGAEEISTQNPFAVNFSNIFEKNLCLQCKSFTCDLSMYSGMMIKLGIKCRNNISSQVVDTCFAFILDGQYSFNETMNGDETIGRSTKRGSIEVHRKLESIESQDFFTNPDKHNNFCTQRKSICDSLECLRCKCLLDFPTFVSYNHGCDIISKENKVFRFHKCMHSETDLVRTDGFNRKRCVYFIKHDYFTHTRFSCAVDSVSYIDPVKDEEVNLAMSVPFKLTTYNPLSADFKFCLQCDFYNCDVSFLYGKLLKFGIKCIFDKATRRDACIVFRMEGKYATNATLLPSDMDKNNKACSSKGNGPSSSVIAGVVVSIVVILLANVVFILIWRRRRNKMRNTKNGNNEFCISKSNIESTEIHEIT